MRIRNTGLSYRWFRKAAYPRKSLRIVFVCYIFVQNIYITHAVIFSLIDLQ